MDPSPGLVDVGQARAQHRGSQRPGRHGGSAVQRCAHRKCHGSPDRLVRRVSHLQECSPSEQTEAAYRVVDVLAMHQAGIVNTVALMGTAISELQIAVLKRLAGTVVLMLSGNDAAAKAILRAGVLARAAGFEVLVASLPADIDPAADLPDDDHELVSFITRLPTVRAGSSTPVGSARVETATARDRPANGILRAFRVRRVGHVRTRSVGGMRRHRRSRGLRPRVRGVARWRPSVSHIASTPGCRPPRLPCFPSWVGAGSGPQHRSLLVARDPRPPRDR